MNLNKASGERARAMELAGASLGFSRETFEQSAAKGIYHAIFEGYKEKHKDEYLALHPKLLAMRAKRDQLLRWTPAMAKGLIAKFLKELEDFEAFMKSMTEVKREAWAPNVITDVGVHQLLDAGLAGSAYTVTGPFMGLIGAVSYSGVPVAANTMASHATWTEAGVTNAPTYTGPRKTIAWSAASGRAKAPSSAPVFAMTATPGTVKGVFLVFGSGAVSTIDNTAGVLYSAGLFTGGDQAVVNTNTVTVTYSTSLT